MRKCPTRGRHGRTRALTATGSPSLFQITRCAENRLPRKQPAPMPNSEPTAIALRSPYRSANVPRTPPIALTRPIRFPIPRKSVTLPRHPFSALPHPTPRTPHQSPGLRHFSPPIRPDPAISPSLLKHPHIRANLAHVRDRPRGPETLPPHEVRPQASLRKGVENWPPATDHRRAPCPTLSHGATLVSQ